MTPMSIETPTAPPRCQGRREETRTTSSEIPVRPFYRPDDMAGIPYEEKVGDPGQFPYTRGLYPDMYRKRHWTMRQYAGYSSAPRSRTAATATSSPRGPRASRWPSTCRPRSATTRTTPMARGEVGRVGVAIDSIEDMRRLFDGIPLDRVTTSMTINATAAILLSLYLAVAEEQGVSWDKVGGTVQNDILKEYAARGTYIYPPGPSLKLVTDVIAFCADRVPKWNTISISGYHMREAGSTAVQEVAFTLANGLTYVAGGPRPRARRSTSFAPRLSFFFNAHNNFLEEVAKFRAARRLWAELVQERFAPQGPPLALAALPHADRGLDAHRPAADEQRGARGDPGPGRGLRRHAVAPHQLARRGAGPAHRGGGPPGPAHPAGDRPRERRGRRGRPPGRLLRGRGVDRRDRAEGARLHPPDRRDGRRAGRPRAGLPAARDRRGRLPLPDRRRGEAAEVVVGVNAFQPPRRRLPTEVLRIDPAAEREQVGARPGPARAPGRRPRRGRRRARSSPPPPARTAT